MVLAVIVLVSGLAAIPLALLGSGLGFTFGVIAIVLGIIAAMKGRGLVRYLSLLGVVAGAIAIPLSHMWSLLMTGLSS
jgi:hypothetical protein